MRRILGIALVIAVCLLAFYQIRQSLRSPADRLSYHMARMVRDFNEGHTRSVARGFHPNFVDASSGADRDRVQQGLYGIKWNYSRDGRFQLEFQWLDAFEPTIDLDQGVAHWEGRFRILDHRFPEPRTWWESPVSLEFVYDGSAWFVTSAEKTTGHPTH